MKTRTRFLLLLLALALFLPSAAQAAALQIQPGIYFGSTVVIKKGETVHGDFLLFGGQFILEEGATLDGSLLAFDTSINLNGTVRGDVLIWGGDLVMGEQVRIEGDVMVERTLLYPSGKEIPVSPLSSALYRLITFRFSPLLATFQILGESLLLALLAFILALFLERQLLNSAQVLVSQPLIAGGLGLLTVLVVPLMALVLTVTLIFIPIGVLLLIALAVALLIGWIALGLELGQRLADFFHRHWRLPVCAALGTFLLTFLATLFGKVPCVGWLPGFLAAVLGLGAVLMSSFGRHVQLGKQIEET